MTVNAPATVTANFGLITQTSLMAVPNPSIFGAGVTLTATVTSSSTPTSGNATFYDGTSMLCDVRVPVSIEVTDRGALSQGLAHLCYGR